MIIVMQAGATEDQIAQVRAKLTQCGFDAHESGGPDKTLIVAVGGKNVDGRDFESLNGVGGVLRISSPYKLASRLLNPEGTRVRVKNVEIGGAEIILMAGPCAVENQAQVIADPSHGTGRRDSIVPMARAAIAAGADGLLIEIHHDPDSALCDGAQSLPPGHLFGLMKQLKTIASSIGRTIAQPVESATAAD